MRGAAEKNAARGIDAYSLCAAVDADRLPAAGRAALLAALLDLEARIIGCPLFALLAARSRDAAKMRAAGVGGATARRGPGVIDTSYAVALAGVATPGSDHLRAVRLSLAPSAGATLRLPLSALIAESDAVEAADRAAELVDKGYRTLKLKVGSAPIEDDHARVLAVRACVGGDVALRLDANQSWGLDEAHRALDLFAPLGVEFVEEPLRGGSCEGLAELRKTGAARVAVDESLVSVEDLDRVIDSGAADVVVLKLARVGGPQAALELAGRAAAAGLSLVFTDSLECSVGMLVTAHVAAAHFVNERGSAVPSAARAGDIGAEEARAATRDAAGSDTSVGGSNAATWTEAEAARLTGASRSAATAGAVPASALRAVPEVLDCPALGLGGAVSLAADPAGDEAVGPSPWIDLRGPGLGLLWQP